MAEDTQNGQGPKPSKKVIDRRHWGAKIGIPFRTLKDPRFKRLYPFDSHLHDIEGYHYHYLDEGEGEPVVMIHGNPTWSFFYRSLILGLRGHYRCLVPDHMGFGFSEKPQKYDYSLEHHILNLENWLENTLPPPSWNGGKINLIVHDWGGPVGLGYAAKHPERISRVVVMNTSVYTVGDMPPRIKMCRWPVIGEYIIRRLNLFAKKAAELTTVKPLDPIVKKYYVMPYNSWNNRVGIYNFVQDIPLEASSPTFKLFHKMENYIETLLDTTPLSIQWGMQDWCFTPYFLNLWKKRFTHAEIHEHKTAGHYLLEDAGPAILKNIKEFLQRPAR